jgi:phage recombination protein Bet
MPGEMELSRYENREIIETIKATVCKGATDAQLKFFIEVCKSTGLNPFLREVWFVPSVGIMAGRDGYLAVANRHPQFDGMETRVDRDDKMVPIKATCTVWRKDRGHPIICEAYYSEYRKQSGVWSQYPSAMISKVAEVLALKRSFAINGVVTEEEIGPQEPAPARSAPVSAMPTPAPVPQDPPPASIPSEPVPAPVPADPLMQVLSGFSRKDNIAAAFAALNKEWRKYESQEAWDQTLEQYAIQGDNYRSIGNAKRCFASLWNSVEKMQQEALEEQNAG